MANEIRVEKCFYDLNEYMDYSGFLTQAEVPYLVFGAEEELAALNAVREASDSRLTEYRHHMGFCRWTDQAIRSQRM